MSPKKWKQEYPIVIETFMPFYRSNDYIQDEPSCFNGMVRVNRYRITVEKISEPHKVLCDRLQMLWEQSLNMNSYDDLKAEAKRLKYDLRGPMGGNKK